MIRLPKVARGPTPMLDQRDPVVVADTGPLLRLAAANLLDAAVRAIREVPFTLAEAQETRLRPYDEPDDDREFSPPSGAGSTGPGSSM